MNALITTTMPMVMRRPMLAPRLARSFLPAPMFWLMKVDRDMEKLPEDMEAKPSIFR